MKTKRIGTMAIFLSALALFLFSGTVRQESAKQLFEKAVHLEETKGDLEKAIEVYKQIVTKFPEDRVLAAQSFYHLGLCYEKLGMRDAQKAFQNVIETYPDQTDTVRLAREKLAALARAQAAAEKREQDLGIQKIWSGLLADPIGGISPDGKHYCFTDWQTGDLAVRELASGKNRRLTDKGPWTKSTAFALLPKFSPDSRSIAYSWWDSDPADPGAGHFELRVIGLEETQPRVLFEHKVAPAADVFPWDWHPDGERILTYFGKHPDTYELGFVSAADGAVQVIKSFKVTGGVPWDFAISPDGRGIAYSRDSGRNPKNTDVFLLSANGTQETCLVEHPAVDQACDWTADGRYLLFKSDRTGVPGLWMVEVKEGKALGTPSLLKANVGPLWPIGCTRQNQFYYSYRQSGTDIYTGEINPVSGQFLAPPVHKVRHYEGGNAIPEYSLDGKHFVYLSSRGFPPRVKYRLCLYSLEDDDFRELDTGLKTIQVASFPQWRPDGRAISLTAVDSKDQRGIFLFELESNKVSLLVQDTREEPVYRQRWALDGKTLYYTRGKFGDSCVYARNLNTGEEKTLSSPADNILEFDISPDGKWLAFVDGEQKGKRNLGILPAAGGSPQRFHSIDVIGRYHINPAWSADGKHIFFCNMSIGASFVWDLWRFSLDDKQVRKVDSQGVNINHASFHPDGRHIIFSTQNQAPPEVWMMENFLPKTKEEK